MSRKEHHPETRWTVYGRRVVGVTSKGEPVHAGLHLEKAITPEDAKAFLTASYMQYGDSVTAVVVELIEGRDENGYRRVVYRMNNGKAWWE